MIPIDGRLKACADFVSEGGKICDVGNFASRCWAWAIFSRFRKSFDGRLASRENFNFINEQN